jgi:hypothetical protein
MYIFLYRRQRLVFGLRKAISFTKKDKEKKRSAKEKMYVADTSALGLKVIPYGMLGRKYSVLVKSSSSLGAGGGIRGYVRSRRVYKDQ